VTSQPLAGRRILVTRGASQAPKLSEGLRALGANPIEVPVLEIRPPASYESLDAALRNLDSYDWLILTSANAVRAIAERASHLGISLDRQASLEVAAVGPATASEAKKGGLAVSLMPETYIAEGMIDLLQTRAHRRRVLIVRAAVARDVIPNALREAGATVDVVDAYRNVLPDAAPEQLRRAVAERIDAATFTSSSSATHLAEAARLAGIAFPLADVSAVSIGPITSETLREIGWLPAAEASPHDIEGLIAAATELLAR